MDVTSRARQKVSRTTRLVESAIGLRSSRFSTTLQLPFAAIYSMLALSCLALAPSQVHRALLVLCLVVCVATTLLAQVVDRRTTWAPLPAVLCSVNIVLVFYLQRAIGVDGVLVQGLAILPAVWLAYVYLWPGALAGVVAVTLVVGLTAWLEPVVGNLYMWVSVGALPLTTLVMTTVCVIITEHWEVQRSRLRAEQEQLDAALGASRTTTVLLESIIASFDSAIVAFSTSGEIIMSNADDNHLWEITWAGEIGASERLVYAEDRTTPLAPHLYPSERAAAGLTTPETILWIGPQGSQQRAVLVSSRRMDDAAGTHLGVMVAYHDVTEMMLALHTKDEFIATVSHELRTPLTSIMGYRELIVDDHREGLTPLTEETLSYLAVIERNADHLLALVTDLLTIAQASSDALDLTLVDCEVHELVERAVESATLRFNSSGVAIHARTCPTATVRADERRIIQVIDNLLSNAVKYTPRGGSVEVSTFSDANATVLVVSDTGIGMSPEDLEHVFAKFHRSESARTSQIPGIGLGLPITKSIVEAHGGSITITSELGRGTTVRVSLPLETTRTSAQHDEPDPAQVTT